MSLQVSRFAQALPDIQAKVDMREALTPKSLITGADVFVSKYQLALPDRDEIRRFLEAQMAEELGSEAAENLEG